MPGPYPPMAMAPPIMSKPQLQTTPSEAAPKRITMWNKKENRKISGNAAPMEKNIDEYLRKHPECEVYNGQRSQLDPAIRAAQLAAEPRITIWNKTERRKVSGNAAPLEKNIEEYLRKHPDCSIYDGQDKRPSNPMPSPLMHGMPMPGPYQMPTYLSSSGPMLMPQRMPMAPTIVPKPLAKSEVQRRVVTDSPVCTLDFLAMVACQENLSLLNAEDYETDNDSEEDMLEEEVKPMDSVTKLNPCGKRSLECSAIDQLVKRVKAA